MALLLANATQSMRHLRAIWAQYSQSIPSTASQLQWSTSTTSESGLDSRGSSFIWVEKQYSQLTAAGRVPLSHYFLHFSMKSNASHITRDESETQGAE